MATKKANATKKVPAKVSGASKNSSYTLKVVRGKPLIPKIVVAVDKKTKKEFGWGMVITGVHDPGVDRKKHDGRPYAIFEGLLVDEAYRGGGVGRAIMDKINQITEEGGHYKSSLHTSKEWLHTFYKSLGYMPHGVSFRKDFSYPAIKKSKKK
jgi:GNAT superfamily N-acetyltransferase